MRVWFIAFGALVSHLVITWVLDLIFGMYGSIFGMMAAIDRPACKPLCFSSSDFSPLVHTRAGYYAFATGSTTWGWAKYGLLQIPGMIGGLAVLFTQLEENAAERGGLQRLILVWLIIFGLALFVAFPQFINFMLAMSELGK